MADISYTRTTWADGQEGGTAIDATKLNNIEQGIVDAVAAIGPNDTTEDGTLKAQIDQNASDISDLQDSVAHGYTPIGVNVNAGQEYEFSVSFGKTMASIPTIILTSGNDSFGLQPKFGSITTSGFNGYAMNHTSGAKTLTGVYWFAVC